MKLIAKTLYGLEQTLADELKVLGAADPKPVNRAVIFEGDQHLLYRVNYCSRTALSVLMQIAEFRINSSNDLFKKCLRLNWGKYLSNDQSFSIVPVIYSPVFSHTGYAGLVMKDAIADWFRHKTGKRPSVNTNDPDIVFNLHISNDIATVSVDSSVIPLFKRGYRKDQVAAPLNEVLAAGIVLLSGWNAESKLIDPMCGSGTIAIEAALIACNIPPGKFRKHFGFQRWKDYDKDLFYKITEECNSKILRENLKIICSDISIDAVMIARRNMDSAGLSEILTAEQRDFSELMPGDNHGFILLNPPYGERMNQVEISSLYTMIGSTLKHNFPGYKAFLITSDKEALKSIGLKPAMKIPLFNGSLECVLVKYELFKGPLNKNRI